MADEKLCWKFFDGQLSKRQLSDRQLFIGQLSDRELSGGERSDAHLRVIYLMIPSHTDAMQSSWIWCR